MATQLASQLKSLVTPQSSIHIPKKRKASILYPPEKATTISRNTYYEIGSRGFLELLSIDGKFKEFETNLFDPRSINNQRALQTSEENKHLDTILERFLIMVSPYINRNAAKQALEWLVERFMIHEMNIDAFVFCILPYHSQATFIRILSVVNLKREEKAWKWLLPYQENGTTIPPKTIDLQWASSVWFRNALTSYFLKAKKILTLNELDELTTFYANTQIGGINACSKVTEAHITNVSRTLGKLLVAGSTKQDELAYSVLLAVSEKVTLSQAFVDVVLERIAKNLLVPDTSVKERLIFILYFCKINQIETISAKAALDFVRNENLLETLKELAADTYMCAYMVPLVKAWVRLLVSEETLDGISSLFEFLIDTPFTNADAQAVFKTLVESLNEFAENFNSMENRPNFTNFFQRIETKHPNCLPSENLLIGSDVLSTDVFEGGSDDDMDVVVEKDNNQTERWIEIVKSIDISSICAGGYQLQGDSYDEFCSAMDVLWEATKASEARYISTTEYEEIIANLLKRKLSVGADQMKLLSLMWTLSCSEEKETFLKLWSLRLSQNLLAVHPKEFAIQYDSDFILTLFVPLCYGSMEVRQDTLSLLHLIGQVTQGKSVDSLLEGVLARKQEILHDISYLPPVFERVMKKQTSPLFKLFMTAIKREDMPFRIKSSLLYCISDITTDNILARLIGTANKTLKSIDVAKELDNHTSLCLYYILMRISKSKVSCFKNADVKEFFLNCLQLDAPVMVVQENRFAPRDFVTRHDLLCQLESCRYLDFGEVLDILVTHVSKSSQPNTTRRLQKQLRKTTISSSTILTVLNNLKLLESSANSVKEARNKYLRIRSNAEEEVGKQEQWHKLEKLIDLVQVLKEISDPQALIGSLFDHLQAIQKFDADFTDILQQKILDTIYTLVQKTLENLGGKDFTKLVELNVSSLVHTIRCSHNPSSQRKALMILTLIAQYYPGDVLLNILPIFTFMGSSLVRRDDRHSVELMHDTIHSIVPVLLKTDSSNLIDVLPKLSEVVQAFVDALQDIPEHRKLPLFTALATLLSEKDQLWILVPLVVDSLVTKMAPNKKENRTIDTINFILRLYSQFDVYQQLQCVLEVLGFTISLPESYEQYVNIKPSERDARLLIIAMHTHTPKQLKSLKYNCAGVLFQLLSSAKFSHELSKTLDEASDVSKCVDLLRKSLSTIISYVESLDQKVTQIETPTQDNFWSRLQKRFMDLLRVTVSLLPADILLVIVGDLLNGTQDDLRLCALKIILSKLQSSTTYFTCDHIALCEDLIQVLVRLSFEEKVCDEMRQLSLLTIQNIIKSFGDGLQKEVILNILQKSANLLRDQQSSLLIEGQMLLTAVEALCYLNKTGLKYLSPLLKKILEVLASAVQNYVKENESLVIVALLSLQNILKCLQDFLSKKVSRAIVLLCRLAVKFEHGASTELQNRVMSTLKQIMAISPLILFPRLSDIHCELEEPMAYVYLMQQLEQLISSMASADVQENKGLLFKFFTASLDLRLTKGFCENIDRIEDSIFSAMLRFMLKFEAKDFIVMYNQLLDDAFQSRTSETGHRVVTFVRYADRCAALLKTLFIVHGVADRTLELAANLLQENHQDSEKDKLFDEDFNTHRLLESTLSMVTTTLKCVKANENPHRYEFIMEPLTNQLDNTMGNREDFDERVRSYLAPCIVAFAEVARDDLLWAELNKQVLSRIRMDDQPMVVLASLEVFEKLIDSLGDEFVKRNLSEIMLYITEGLEAHTSETETKIKQIFSKLRIICGESLHSYIED